MFKDLIKKASDVQVSPKTTNVFKYILLFAMCVFLFLLNIEGITLINNELTPFIFWITTTYGLCAYITLFILFGVTNCIIGNFFISYLVMEILTLCFGIANRVVFFVRDQYITIADFKILGEALKVDINIVEFFHPCIIVFIVIGIILGFCAWFLTKSLKKDKVFNCNKKAIVLARFAISSVLIVAFVFMHKNTVKLALDYVAAYKTTGETVWFCKSIFGNTSEAVSKEEINQIYMCFEEQLSVKEEVSEKRPNVIVIMSEAFWDINNWNGLVQSKINPMDKYYELVSESVTGELAVNVFGGGTNQTEFEFLTGINSKYLISMNGYGEYYSLKQESMVSYMEQLGYYTMAFHPYDKEFWDRHIGYSNMGFDAFYSDVEFMNKEMYRGYISDKSLTYEIIERFEIQKKEQPQQPIFSFAVSIQNHISDMSTLNEVTENFEGGIIATQINISGVEEIVAQEINEYYNGMYESIEALEALMDYFENYDEETVIVFFGDHAPSLAKNLNATEKKMYRTPYMIWANYDIDYQEYGDMNVSYLSSALIDYLDLPKPNQYYVNMYMLEHYPINTRYEQERKDSIEDERILDMMSIYSTIVNRFPKEEMALPIWSLTE